MTREEKIAFILAAESRYSARKLDPAGKGKVVQRLREGSGATDRKLDEICARIEEFDFVLGRYEIEDEINAVSTDEILTPIESEEKINAPEAEINADEEEKINAVSTDEVLKPTISREKINAGTKEKVNAFEKLFGLKIYHKKIKGIGYRYTEPTWGGKRCHICLGPASKPFSFAKSVEKVRQYCARQVRSE